MDEQSFLVAAVYTEHFYNGFRNHHIVRFIKSVSREEAVGKFLASQSVKKASAGLSMAVEPQAFSTVEIESNAR